LRNSLLEDVAYSALGKDVSHAGSPMIIPSEEIPNRMEKATQEVCQGGFI
jgi:hypothetical protein